MDMSYATIPIQDGSRRLYCEKRTPYVVSSQDRADIHHIYVVDTDLGSSIFLMILSRVIWNLHCK